MLMFIKNLTETTTIEINESHKLENFFAAHALVENGELVTYATNFENWFNIFQKNWRHDPIVSKIAPGSSKLHITNWLLPLHSPEHRDFFNLRSQLTGANNGYTAYRSYSKTKGICSEFYAIAPLEDNVLSNELIQNPMFVKYAFVDMVNQFRL